MPRFSQIFSVFAGHSWKISKCRNPQTQKIRKWLEPQQAPLTAEREVRQVNGRMRDVEKALIPGNAASNAESDALGLRISGLLHCWGSGWAVEAVSIRWGQGWVQERVHGWVQGWVQWRVQGRFQGWVQRRVQGRVQVWSR